MTNALLLPSQVVDREETLGESDYLTAQRDGQIHQDCSGYRGGCPISFFQVFCMPAIKKK